MGSFIEILFALALPPAAYIILRRKTDAAVKPLVVGYIAYIAISGIRAIFRMLALGGLSGVSWVFVSALLSGVLEEVGRYAAMKYAMHEHDRWRDAISYGIGHGGAELFLGVLPYMLNDFLEGESSGGIFIMASNAVMIAFHISMSVLVMASVHYRDGRKFLYTAIAIHFLADFIPGVLRMYSVMIMLFVDLLIAAAAVYYAYITAKKLDEDI